MSVVKAVAAPRTRLEELGGRNESVQTGEYVLVGPDVERPGRDGHLRWRGGRGARAHPLPRQGREQPEADLADMEQFLEHMKLMLGVLGAGVFGPTTRRPDPTPAGPAQPPGGISEDVPQLTLEGGGYEARAARARA